MSTNNTVELRMNATGTALVVADLRKVGEAAKQVGVDTAKLGDGARVASGGLDTLDQAARGSQTSLQTAGAAAESYIAALLRQTQTFGATADEVRRYDASLLQASATQQAQLSGLLSQAAAQEKAAIAIRNADQAARASQATQQAAAQQTQNFIAALERQNATFGKTPDQVRRYEASLLGMTQAQQAHTTTLLRQAAANDRVATASGNTAGKFGQVGMSAAAMNAALRGVPAQFTDIATSLAAGQPPMQVFLQQGGQLKDMFGGVGPAAKALGGYVLGLISPLTIAAAAAGLLIYAFSKGASESAAFQQTIIMTGNASGVTVGQLNAMAQSIGAVTGTQGKAAEALNTMAGSGAVASKNLEAFTTTAIELEKTVGQSVAETASKFKQLADEPLKASIKFNESLNYLTSSTYKHIRALEEQGRKTEAVEVAQNAYAQASQRQADQVAQSAGIMERAWRSLWGVVTKAWDAMAGIGREQTINDRLGAVNKQIAELESQRAKPSGIGSAFGGMALQGGADPNTERALTQLRAQAAALGAQAAALGGVAYAAEQAAKAEAERGEKVKTQISWDELKNKNLNKGAELQRALTEAENKAKANGVSLDSKEYTDVVAQIRDRYKEVEKGAAGAKAAARDLINSQVEQVKNEQRLADVEAKRYQDEVAHQARMGRIGGADLVRATAGADLQEFDARALRIQHEIDLQGKQLNSKKAVEALEGELARNAEERLSRQIKMSQDLEFEAKKVEDARLKAAADAINGSVAELAALKEKNLAAQVELGNIGLTAGQLSVLTRMRMDEVIAIKQRRIAVMEAYDDGTNGGQIAAEIEQLKQLKLARDVAAQTDLKKTFAKFDDYFNPAKAQTFGDAIRDAFAGASSAAAGFGNALGAVIQKQAELGNLQQELNDRRRSLDTLAPDKRQAAEIELTEKQNRLNQEVQRTQVEGFARMAGAAKGFFKENSKGYQAMSIVEKAFTAVSIAQSVARGAALAIEAVAKQASNGDVWSAFARMAAMAAAMAALGFAVGGSGGGAALPTAETRQREQGTGTVFGDPEAKSNSLKNSYERLLEVSKDQLGTENKMLDALRGIQSAMAGLANQLIRSSGITTGGNLGLRTGVLSVNQRDPLFPELSTIGVKDPIFGGFIRTALSWFGKVKADITDAGIQIQGSLANLGQGRGIQQYADLTTTTSSFFGLIKKQNQSTQTGEVSQQISNQFALIFRGIRDSLVQASQTLGLSIESTIDAAFVDTVISLKGLKGQELQDAIANAISAAADKAAQSVIAGLDDFQQVGEGYYETVIRVVSGIQEASAALDRLGIAAVSFRDITDKQGDVAAEIVRQSIQAVETNGVGDIIKTLTGNASEIVQTYSALVALRDTLRTVGAGAADLSGAMIRGAGGLDKLTQGTNSYVANFLNAGQRSSAELGQLREQFEKINQTMPTNREGFVALVKRIDTSTEAGQRLFGEVMALAGAFDTAQRNADALRASYEQNYLSTAERIALETERMRLSFEALGFTLPTTREELRRMIEEAGALGTAAGNARRDALLGLAQPFAQLVQPTEVQPVQQYVDNTPQVDYEAIAKQEADKRKQAEGAFRDSYYSEAEKTAYATREVTAELAAMGYALPKTREQFRAMAEVARDKGWDQTYGKLLDIGTRFADLVPEIEQTTFDLAGFQSALADLPFDYLRTASAAAAEAMVKNAGGLDAFVAAQRSYVENYFTQEERSAIAMQRLVQQFDQMNTKLPKTRDEFKQLVDEASRHIETEPGRAYYQQLLSMNAAFAQAVPAIEAVKQKIYSINEQNDESWYAGQSDRTQAFQAEQQAAEAAADKVRQQWQQVADAIGGSMKGLREELLGQSYQALSAVQAQFAISTAAARAGDVKAAGELPQLAKSLVEISKQNGTSQLEQTLLTARTLASLSQTLDGLQQFGAVINDDANRVATPSAGYSAPGTYVAPALPPAAVAAAVTAGGGNAGNGNVDMAALLRELVALRAEMTLVRASSQDNERNTDRTARALGALSPDGLNLNVRVVA